MNRLTDEQHPETLSGEALYGYEPNYKQPVRRKSQ